MHVLPPCGTLPMPFVQGRLHVVPWALIGILMNLLAAEPHSNTGIAYLIKRSESKTICRQRVRCCGTGLF